MLDADAGFTLIEVVVAIVLIFASLLTVIGAANAALGYQAIARQRQVATVLATRVLEEARRLPFATVQAGNQSSAILSDPNLVGGAIRCGSVAISSASRPVIQIAAPPTGTVLNPHVTSLPAPVDGVVYRASTYVTRAFSGGVFSGPYQVWVCVQWSYRGVENASYVEGAFWSPQGSGCVGRPSDVVSGPCVELKATIPDGAVAIDVVHNGVSDSVSFAIAGASSTVSLKEVASASASYTAAYLPTGAPLTAMPEDQRTSVSVDDDGATGVDDLADTTLLSLPGTPTQSPSGHPGFQISYATGSAQASASVRSSTSCASAGVLASISSSCAAAGVERGAAWIDTRYAIGDDYFIRPFWLTAASGFGFGTRAALTGMSTTAEASRSFTLLRMGGVPTGRGVAATFVNTGSLFFSDAVSLSGGVSVASDQARAVNSPVGTVCSGITYASPSTTQDSPAALGCTHTPTTPLPAGEYTLSILFDFSWKYVERAQADTGLVGGNQIITSSSPTLQLVLTVNRKYCLNYNASRTNCRNDSNVRWDTYVITIELSLGTSQVSLETRA